MMVSNFSQEDIQIHSVKMVYADFEAGLLAQVPLSI